MFKQALDQFEIDGYGVTGFETFSRACFQLVKDDEAHAISYFVLGAIAERFAYNFAERPLTAALAEEHFERIRAYARTIEAEAPKSVEDQLQAINTIILHELRPEKSYWP